MVQCMIRRFLGYRAPTSVPIRLIKYSPLFDILLQSGLRSPKFKYNLFLRIQKSFTRYALHYPTIDNKERFELLHLTILFSQRDDGH